MTPNEILLLKRISNIFAVILAGVAIYLWVYGTTRLGAVAVGIALASIPLVRLLFTTMMVTDEALDIAKVSNKAIEKVTKHTKEVVEIAGEKDKMIKELMGMVHQSLDVIDELRDEVRPLNLVIKNKGDVIVTLVEDEKIKVTYGNQSDYATPESLGMVDKKKTASLYWIWLKWFCEFGGYMNFNLNYDYSDKKVKNRRP